MEGKIGLHEFSLSIEPIRGLNSFLVHWFGKAKYPKEFIRFVSSINEYHGCKATGHYETFDDLRDYTTQAILFLKENGEN